MATQALITNLKQELERIARDMGWNDIKVFTAPRDPAGRFRLGYLAHQGTMSVTVEQGEQYLEWLRAGGRGTIIKWAAEARKKLK